MCSRVIAVPVVVYLSVRHIYEVRFCLLHLVHLLVAYNFTVMQASNSSNSWLQVFPFNEQPVSFLLFNEHLHCIYFVVRSLIPMLVAVVFFMRSYNFLKIFVIKSNRKQLCTLHIKYPYAIAYARFHAVV